MKEIVLDTETTGMDPDKGDRIVEIGCVELFNHIPTGRTLQLYINPERDVPAEATAIHGITNEFLKDKPVFLEVYTEFTDFIEGATLVIHNAEFDMKFINHHLHKVGMKPVPWTRVVDTLTMARKKFPGSPANLDALCRRFGIDNTQRTYHGALLDSELLAEVYLELLGGRQHGLGLVSDIMRGDEHAPLSGDQETMTADGRTSSTPSNKASMRALRSFVLSEEERAAHEAMLAQIKAPLWKQA